MVDLDVICRPGSWSGGGSQAGRYGRYLMEEGTSSLIRRKGRFFLAYSQHTAPGRPLPSVGLDLVGFIKLHPVIAVLRSQPGTHWPPCLDTGPFKPI